MLSNLQTTYSGLQNLSVVQAAPAAPQLNPFEKMIVDYITPKLKTP